MLLILSLKTYAPLLCIAEGFVFLFKMKRSWAMSKAVSALKKAGKQIFMYS